MDSKEKILELLPSIVPQERKENDGEVTGYTIGEDGKLFREGKYVNIQYDTKYLLWRLDMPYDKVCEKINILRSNPICTKEGYYGYIPMPVACIDEYFYFRNINEITSFISEGDVFLVKYSPSFPIMTQEKWEESYKDSSEMLTIEKRYRVLRDVYPSFGYMDIEGVKKVLAKIDYVKILRVISHIFEYCINNMHPNDETKKFLTEANSEINQRIKDIKNGKNFIQNLAKKSKGIFIDEPHFKPKEDIIKGYMNSFVSNDANYSMLCGVYYDEKNSYAVACNGSILAAVPSVYNKQNKGLSVEPDGKTHKGTYPNWLSVIPSKERLTKLDIEVNDLWKFVTRLSKQNKEKAGSAYTKGTSISGTYSFCRLEINLGGKWTSYSIEQILKLLSLANRLGNGHLYSNIEHEYPMVMFMTDDKKPSYILVIPMATEIEYKGQSIIAEHYYTDCLYEYFYEPDKSQSNDNTNQSNNRMRMIQLQAKAAVAKLKLMQSKSVDGIEILHKSFFAQKKRPYARIGIRLYSLTSEGGDLPRLQGRSSIIRTKGTRQKPFYS